jgi:hypothetical protein
MVGFTKNENSALICGIANFLIWLGVLFWPIPNTVIFASAISSLACIYFFWKFLVVGNCFYDQLGFASLCLQLALCFSFIFAGIINLVFLNTGIEDLLKSMKITSEAYATAMLFCMQTAIFFALSGLFSPIKKRQIILAERIKYILNSPTRNILFIGLIISFFQAGFIFLGLIDVRRINYGMEGGLPWFVPIFEFSKSFSIPLSSLLTTHFSLRSRTINKSFILVVLFLLIGTNLYILFFSTRREFISSVILFAVYLIYFNKSLLHRSNFAILAIISLFLFIPVLNAINSMRSLGGSDLTSSQKFYFVIENQFKKIKVDGILVEDERENYAYRPLILGIQATVMDMPINAKKYLYGENLLNSIIWALPSFIVSNKNNILIQEDLFYESLPNLLFFTDQANSINLEAYSDFSWAGPFVYVIFYSLIWYITLVILLNFKNSFSFLSGFCVYPPFWCQCLAEGSTLGFLNVFRFFLFSVILMIIIVPIVGIARRSLVGVRLL